MYRLPDFRCIKASSKLVWKSHKGWKTEAIQPSQVLNINSFSSAWYSSLAQMVSPLDSHKSHSHQSSPSNILQILGICLFEDQSWIRTPQSSCQSDFTFRFIPPEKMVKSCNTSLICDSMVGTHQLHG